MTNFLDTLGGVASFNTTSYKFYTPKIEIKDSVTIGQNCHITAANQIIIGSHVNILPQVLITDMEHDHVFNIDAMDTSLTVGYVEIDDYAFIGMGARIMGAKGVKIGRSAVVGANSVVTKDVPEGAIVAGVPAVIIGRVPSLDETTSNEDNTSDDAGNNSS